MVPGRAASPNPLKARFVRRPVAYRNAKPSGKCWAGKLAPTSAACCLSDQSTSKTPEGRKRPNVFSQGSSIFRRTHTHSSSSSSSSSNRLVELEPTPFDHSGKLSCQNALLCSHLSLIFCASRPTEAGSWRNKRSPIAMGPTKEHHARRKADDLCALTSRRARRLRVYLGSLARE